MIDSTSLGNIHVHPQDAASIIAHNRMSLLIQCRSTDAAWRNNCSRQAPQSMSHHAIRSPIVPTGDILCSVEIARAITPSRFRSAQQHDGTQQFHQDSFVQRHGQSWTRSEGDTDLLGQTQAHSVMALSSRRQNLPGVKRCEESIASINV